MGGCGAAGLQGWGWGWASLGCNQRCWGRGSGLAVTAPIETLRWRPLGCCCVLWAGDSASARPCTALHRGRRGGRPLSQLACSGCLPPGQPHWRRCDHPAGAVCGHPAGVAARGACAGADGTHSGRRHRGRQGGWLRGWLDGWVGGWRDGGGGGVNGQQRSRIDRGARACTVPAPIPVTYLSASHCRCSCVAHPPTHLACRHPFSIHHCAGQGGGRQRHPVHGLRSRPLCRGLPARHVRGGRRCGGVRLCGQHPRHWPPLLCQPATAGPRGHRRWVGGWVGGWVGRMGVGWVGETASTQASLARVLDNLGSGVLASLNSPASTLHPSQQPLPLLAPASCLPARPPACPPARPPACLQSSCRCHA